MKESGLLKKPSSKFLRFVLLIVFTQGLASLPGLATPSSDELSVHEDFKRGCLALIYSLIKKAKPKNENVESAAPNSLAIVNSLRGNETFERFLKKRGLKAEEIRSHDALNTLATYFTESLYD